MESRIGLKHMPDMKQRLLNLMFILTYYMSNNSGYYYNIINIPYYRFLNSTPKSLEPMLKASNQHNALKQFGVSRR